MKLNSAIFTLIIPALLLCSCNEKNEQDQIVADEVAANGAIALVLSGRDGSQVMFAGEDAQNSIFKPYNPPVGSPDRPIYTSTLSLSVWFKISEDSEEKATLNWTFDKPEYVKIVPPASEILPHENVTFLSYPAYGEQIKLVLTGEITYHSAKSTAIYNIYLENRNPNDA